MNKDKKSRCGQMDSRCPRKLKGHPESFCPLAVLRLKAIRNAGKELTEEEESKLPGCQWAVNHQISSYCFFKYMANFGEEGPPSESEIAHMLNVSVDTVRKIQKVGLDKIRSKEMFSEIIEAYKDSGGIIPDTENDSYKIKK